jgi:hypothetical protein
VTVLSVADCAGSNLDIDVRGFTTERDKHKAESYLAVLSCLDLSCLVLSCFEVVSCLVIVLRERGRERKKKKERERERKKEKSSSLI